jgi:hypothetical protein
MVSDLRPPRAVVSDLQPPRMVFVDLRPPFHAGCNYATDIIGGRKCASTMWRWSQICDHQKQSVVIVRAPIYLSHGGLMFKTSIFVVVSNTRPPFLAPMVVAHRRPHHECQSNYTVPGTCVCVILRVIPLVNGSQARTTKSYDRAGWCRASHSVSISSTLKTKARTSTDLIHAASHKSSISHLLVRELSIL